MTLKLKSIIWVLILTLFPLSAFAADFPHALWEPLSNYEQAQNSGDDNALFYWGKQVIEIMKAEPDTAVKTQFLAGKLEQISRCAERLGLYDEAVAFYEEYLPYGEAMGWDDGVMFAKRKLLLLKSRLDVFVESREYEPPFFGAKFEPRSGVLFGSVYDDDSRILDFDTEKILEHFPKKNSVYLMYLEFGEDIATIPRYQRYLSDAKKNGVSVLLAWNTYSSLADIEDYKSYVKHTIDYLDSMGINIFLRFANEMNIGPNGDDKDAYVNSFRYVAKYAKQKENIAMVWSPSDLGALDRPFSDYYPGDEYVDWVGVSLYTIKYFMGQRDHGDQTDPFNTYFITGEYANPVLRLAPIVSFMEENNIQKPLMVTEGGVSHQIRTMGEDAGSWAGVQLDRMYGELIRVYPQLKLMCYFNVEMNEEIFDYALFNNLSLNQRYNALVENLYYLSQSNGSAGFAYRPFYGGEFSKDETLKLSTSAWYPKKLQGKVSYFVDGGAVFETDTSPFEYALSLADLELGAHQIGVRYESDGRVLLEKSFDIWIKEPDISVFINQQKVNFPDQKPIIDLGRTLVPVRGVFEKMGMEVSWDEKREAVLLYNREISLEIVIGQEYITKIQNGREVTVPLDIPARIVGGRTMLPLRAILETMHAKVGWMAEQRRVDISYESGEGEYDPS